MLGYKCGLRLGEAFALTWDCVDFENHSININKQVQYSDEKKVWYFTNPKYNSMRIIEIDSELTALLLREKERQDRAKPYYDEYYTYLYEDNNRIINDQKNGLQVDLVSVRECGTFIQPRIMQHTSSVIHHQMNFQDFTYHSLRHTHATMLAENDAPPKYVQTRLGHKNIQITMQIYQHLTKKISDKGTEILETMFETKETV